MSAVPAATVSSNGTKLGGGTLCRWLLPAPDPHTHPYTTLWPQVDCQLISGLDLISVGCSHVLTWATETSRIIVINFYNPDYFQKRIGGGMFLAMFFLRLCSGPLQHAPLFQLELEQQGKLWKDLWKSCFQSPVNHQINTDNCLVHWLQCMFLMCSIAL